MLANEWEKVQMVLTFSDNVNIITMKNKEGKFQATEEELQNTTVPLTVLSEQVKENNNEPTQQKQTVTKEDEDFIDKLNKLINDNMAGEELSIKFLTDNMAMSRASLYHKVKTPPPDSL